MKSKTHNKCYGYKICYYEEDKKTYARHFLTYTYDQALSAVNGYVRYPPKAREDSHILINPTWKIIPVSRKEVQDGIWKDDPF